MAARARHRLFVLAHGRSGDKGDTVNIGVIARRPEWYPTLAAELPAARVAEYFRPLGTGPVERFELPNLWALNFVIRRALGGGGALGLRLDAQGKTYAQALLRMPLELSDEIVRAALEHWGSRLPDDCVLPGR